MSDVTCVVEGKLKYRDGKRWKQRWCVIKKPSPAADRLHVQLYKDVKDVSRTTQPKNSFFVECFYGLETGLRADKENHVMAIICQKQVILLAFENREAVIHFEIKIRRSLGEEDQFPVQISKVPSTSKLPLDNVRMLIHGPKFCFVTNKPPKLLASWQLCDLRKFGMFAGKFVFEGGKSCGKGAGVHVLTTDQADEIEEILQQASEGKTASCSKSNKRRSQAFDYLEPMKNYMGDKSIKEYRNRQAFADLNLMDDNGWRKRRSLSHKDYGCEPDFQSRLTSIENIVREKQMAHYDVPPRRIKKVESFKRKASPSHYYQNARSLGNQTNQGSSQLSSTHTDELCAFHTQQFIQESSVIDRFHHYGRSESCDSSVVMSSCLSQDLSEEDFAVSSACLNTMTKVSASEPVLCGKGVHSPTAKTFEKMFDNSLSNSVPNSIDDDKSARQEEIDSLKKSELMLQKEISLLDEILSGVNFQASSITDADKAKEKPPPLPKKSSGTPNRPTHINLSPRDDRYSTMSSQGSISGYSDSILLSPNLLTKLRKIPQSSKISAPLPYVNLEKYDVGDVDNSHVYMPESYDGNHSAPCRRSESCDNIGKKRYHCNSKGRVPPSEMRRRCDSESVVGSVAIREPIYSNEENIYANDYPFKENSPPPPELPPKGPSLLRKVGKVHRHGLPPPIPYGHHRLSLNLSHRHPHGSPKMTAKTSKLHEPYKSPSRRQNGCSDMARNTRVSLFSEGDENDRDVVLRVRLPNQTTRPSHAYSRSSSFDSDPHGYMDMSGMFEDEKASIKAGEVTAEKTPSKFYGRSHSASSVMEGASTRHGHVNGTAKAATPIREENYLLMSDFSTPKKSPVEIEPPQKEIVCSPAKEDIPSGIPQCASDSEICNHQRNGDQKNGEEPTLPFPNLMNFQQGLLPQSSPQGNVKNSNNVPSCKSSGVRQGQENGDKNPGFFTRLIRRNSGNRKSVSQSQENLLASSSSESHIDKTGAAVNPKNDAGASNTETSEVTVTCSASRSQSQQDVCLSVAGRRRSSSFPNRSSFVDMLVKLEPLKRDQSDTCFSSDSQDETKHLLDQESEGSENNVAEKGSKGYSGPFVCSSEEKKDESKVGYDDKDDEDDCKSPKSQKKLKGNRDVGIFTVLHVDQPTYEMDKNTSKTDDEKMIELLKYSSKKDYFSDTDSSKSSSQKSEKLKSNASLPFNKSMSPSEEAAAIAKHVSSLAPFVPPKQKSYPCSLSPVLETMPSLPKVSNSQVSDYGSMRSFRSNRSLGSVSKADLEAALAKIVGKSQEESIWIPRSQSDSSLCKSSSRTVTSEDQDAKFAALVVEIDRDSDLDDTISLSSQESYNTKEEVVHNSPGTTVLRPRTGKNYLVVERKRPLNEGLDSSPVQSPNSPSVTSSVFTFDHVSTLSGYSKDRESPNVPKFTRSDSMHSRFSDRISPPKGMYMNIDMTPPSSPSYVPGLSPPSEALERQLNYADIDLTLPTRASTRKLRKASMKSIKIPKTETIDYALIDMEATEAIQRLGIEHQMSRENSLRRPNQKLTLPPQQIEEESVETASTITSVSTVKEDTASTIISASVPDDFKIPISATHKYVNVPPPKDQCSEPHPSADATTSDEGRLGSNLDHEIFQSPEDILLPIREKQDDSSSDDEIFEDDDSSDDEVLIVE